MILPIVTIDDHVIFVENIKYAVKGENLMNGPRTLVYFKTGGHVALSISLPDFIEQLALAATKTIPE